jgi:hypothetical protein
MARMKWSIIIREIRCIRRKEEYIMPSAGASQLTDWSGALE